MRTCVRVCVRVCVFVGMIVAMGGYIYADKVKILDRHEVVIHQLQRK